MQVFRKWILYSTLLSVFCSRFLIVVGGVTLFYFYFIFALNLFLLAIRGYLWTPAKLRWFLTYLFCSGVLGLALGTNSTAGFVKSFVGISICALSGAAFMRYERFDALQMFKLYSNFAFYAAVLGLVMFPAQVVASTGRLTSVFLEPSGFAIVCLPAIFYYADSWQRTRQNGVRLLTLCVALLLTFSSLGFMGLLFGGFLFGLRYRLGRLLVPPVLIVGFIFLYNNSELFQTRVTDTVLGLSEGDVSGLNESSFGVVANLFITERQFVDHPFIGGGLGSHVVTHERYIEEIPGGYFLPEYLRNLGEWDASSLMLRIISEFGLVGVVATFWYLWYYFPPRSTPQERAVSMAILCYIFMKFLRSGEYFGGEQFFFLSIYTVIGVTARLRRETARRKLAEMLQRFQPAIAPALNSLPAESH